MDIPGTSTCGDAPELARVLLHAYTKSPPEIVESELCRFLWNSAGFGRAIPLGQSRAVLTAGQGGHFIFHKRTGMLFTGVNLGGHQLLMAYLATLDRTDFSANFDDVSDWGPDSIYGWNASAKLGDEFVETGLGLYQSSQANGAITVAPGFQWTPQEKAVFRGFERRSPSWKAMVHKRELFVGDELEDGSQRRRRPYPRAHVLQAHAFSEDDLALLAAEAYEKCNVDEYSDINVVRPQSKALEALNIDIATVHARCAAALLETGVMGAERAFYESSVAERLDFLTCAGAAFHNDTHGHWTHCLFWVLVLDATQCELLMRAVRIPPIQQAGSAASPRRSRPAWRRVSAAALRGLPHRQGSPGFGCTV